MSTDELLQAHPVIEGKLWFVPLRSPNGLQNSALAASSICYCIDDSLLYEPFFADFGPINLGKTYRFCKQTQDLLQEAERTKKRVYFYCGPAPTHKANAAVLIGIFQVIFLNRTADEAYRPLQAFKPYIPFRDASCGVSTFHLTVLDVIKGIQKARDVAFIDWNSGCSTWSLQEYEHYEQVENGDLNWIVPGKLVAFSGPANRGNEIAGYRLHTPEDYWDYWRKKGVSAVVRLNKKVYDRQRFVQGGFRHYDLYFPDGSCPSEAIVLKFLEIAESEPGAVAIHCKAGLGRTGVLICSYIMKHFKFTAEEVIGYIRVCRPGSVIGPQQNYVRDIEARMWHEGDMWRAARGINKAHLALGDLVINGKAAHTGANVDMAALHLPSSPHAAAMNNFGRAPSNGYRQSPASPGSMNNAAGLGMVSRGSTASTTPTSPTSAFVNAGFAMPTSVPSTATHQGRARDSATSLNSSPTFMGGVASDYALTHFKQQQSTAPHSNSSGGSGMGFAKHLGLSVRVPSSPVVSLGTSGGGSPSGSASSTPTGKQTPSTTGSGACHGAGARIPARSITPLRYGNSGPHTAAAAGLGGFITGVGFAGRMVSGPAASITRSTPTIPARAPSVDQALDRNAIALRASAPPTDSTHRPIDVVIERNVMSADPSFASRGSMSPPMLSPAASMVTRGGSMPIPTTPKPAAPGQRKDAGVARTLAPNGQPRKVPLAMLPAYHATLATGGKPTGPTPALASSPSTPVSPAHAVMITAQQPSLELGRLKAQAAQLRYAAYNK